ncbi:Uncharacterised protein [Mycobacteroides abscessus subsp. abscessus]|nr:Uncharacterised protein [Mycobacteroides abscessus subsp. abscessus]SKU59266.1 Uncharacterised protein [Mycobacteroides abscessus subsp. abscessus]
MAASTAPTTMLTTTSISRPLYPTPTICPVRSAKLVPVRPG